MVLDDGYIDMIYIYIYTVVRTILPWVMGAMSQLMGVPKAPYIKIIKHVKHQQRFN